MEEFSFSDVWRLLTLELSSNLPRVVGNLGRDWRNSTLLGLVQIDYPWNCRPERLIHNPRSGTNRLHEGHVSGLTSRDVPHALSVLVCLGI